MFQSHLDLFLQLGFPTQTSTPLERKKCMDCRDNTPGFCTDRYVGNAPQEILADVCFCRRSLVHVYLLLDYFALL